MINQYIFQEQNNDVIEMMKGEIASLQSQMNLQQATIGTLKETISQNTKKIESLERRTPSAPTPNCKYKLPA